VVHGRSMVLVVVTVNGYRVCLMAFGEADGM
jgi:hypothetical protein